MQKQAAISDIISSLTDLIVLYTNRVEDLDELSTNYAMTTLGFIGVIFGIIATLLYNRIRLKKWWRMKTN